MKWNLILQIEIKTGTPVLKRKTEMVLSFKTMFEL